MKPLYDQHENIERMRLLWLLGWMTVLTALLVIFVPRVSFLSAFSICLVSMICMRLAARFHNKRKTAAKVTENYCPSMSIIVAAHNEESVIEGTLKALNKIDYPNYELCVIDDRSTDATGAILDKLAIELGSDAFVYLKRIEDGRTGKAAAVNDALKQTKGEIICLLDADARVEPDFLTSIAPYFSEPRVGAVQVRKYLLNERQNLLTRCQHYEFCMDSYFQFVRDTIYGAAELRGNGMIVRRETLKALGGLNELTLAEDLDFTTRMHIAGWDVRFASTVNVWEEGPHEVRALVRQRMRWTEGCIVRYLENAHNLLGKREVSWRAKVDMVQFVFEFVAPICILIENCLLTIKLLCGQLSTPFMAYSATALLALTFYFLYATYRGLRHFDGAPVLSSICNTICLYLYFSILWPPIVFSLLTRMLLNKRRNLVWHKTHHYGMAAK